VGLPGAGVWPGGVFVVGLVLGGGPMCSGAFRKAVVAAMAATLATPIANTIPTT